MIPISSGFIGVFDSGVGGLTVLRAIRHRLPASDLVYIADSAWVPYGEKPPETILSRSRVLTGWLLEHGAAAIVIACNTATAAAATDLRAALPVPVIGMEPAVKPATSATRSRIIGVLATSGTLKSARFAGLLDRFGNGYQVLTSPCPDLVDAVERADLDSMEIRQRVEARVRPLIEQGADVLVLGCTHFPFLKPLIQQAAGPGIAIIDTGDAVARQVERRLPVHPATAAADGATHLFSTSPRSYALDILRKLWPEPNVTISALSI